MKWSPSSSHVGEIAHVILVGEPVLVEGAAGQHIDCLRLRDVPVPPLARLLPVRELLVPPLLPLGRLTHLLQPHDVLPVDQHLGVALVLWVPGLLEEALVGVEVHVEHASVRLVLVLPRGHVGEVGPRLEQRRQRVDHEEDDEDVVEVEPALSLLPPLAATVPPELIPESS
jgi:hypothetical protein